MQNDLSKKKVFFGKNKENIFVEERKMKKRKRKKKKAFRKLEKCSLDKSIKDSKNLLPELCPC